MTKMLINLIIKALPAIISAIISWISGMGKKKEEKVPPAPAPEKPKEEVPDVPAPEKPKEEVPDVPAPEKPKEEVPPAPVPVPPAPIFDEGVLVVGKGINFLAYLTQDDSNEVKIKHRNGNVYLINVKVRDVLFIDSYVVQQIGLVRLTLNFNGTGNRTLRVVRDDLEVASMSIIIC